VFNLRPCLAWEKRKVIQVAKHKTQKKSSLAKDTKLYTLDVFIISGPIDEKFIKKNKVICRTIQIRGDQTLEELHYAIFDAFDREEEHMYEFQIGGKRPLDPKARRYVLPMTLDVPLSDGKSAGNVTRTTIDSLGLKVDQVFGYWFDFGDDWWHQVNVVAIEDEVPSGRYPKLTKRVGESPPQYMDWDEEEDDDEDEDEDDWEAEE